MPQEELANNIAQWEADRNTDASTVHWRFTTDDGFWISCADFTHTCR